MKRVISFAVMAVLALGSAVSLQAFDKAEEKKEEKKSAAFCPVMGIGHDVDESVSIDFEGGKLHFCCEKCIPGFKKDEAKFAAAAHHQMVATGQMKQVKCPFSGGKLNPEQKVTIAGVEVAFCCDKCKGKVEKAKEDKDKVEMVFKDTKKGFEMVKKDKEKVTK